MAAYTATDLAASLQQDLDTATATLCLKIAADVAHTYTRGAGFDPITGDPGDDLAAVILTSAGRGYVNPTHAQQETIDDYTVRFAGFSGWTLSELAVLNTYRRRAA